jgi:hypothetical protein
LLQHCSTRCIKLVQFNQPNTYNPLQLSHARYSRTKPL